MDNTITRTAYELTIKFQDTSDIPTRIKKGKKTKTKIDLNSRVERVFQKHIEHWTETINSILKHTKDKEQAWRFIRMNPKIDDPRIDSVTLCTDFIAFHDLFYKRRDIDNCPDVELGNLSLLVTCFQKEVEKQIKK
ncbi:hypothetical protein [Balneola vulgaris]|uniref:hypothetical protein n=1 Tax=Balneola vulgaris TaxID=287535 RepID=UPI0012FBCF83|nr:hypothetical protein [Balneola vulgaris]